MDIINVKKLDFSYDSEKKILEDITFTVQEGDFVAILGDSGCGKSTLCHIMCGIIPNAIGGQISGSANIAGFLLKDSKINQLASKIGFVMQDPDRQIITSAVEDELAFGPENFCMEPTLIRDRVEETLQMIGLKEKRNVNPNQLSGGEKQMLAIGSVLTLNPDIFILDEPFSHLDKENRKNIESILMQLKAKGKTILIVEHDYKLASMADKWMLLEEGKIKAYDTPEKVREFL